VLGECPDGSLRTYLDSTGRESGALSAGKGTRMLSLGSPGVGMHC